MTRITYRAVGSLAALIVLCPGGAPDVGAASADPAGNQPPPETSLLTISGVPPTDLAPLPALLGTIKVRLRPRIRPSCPQFPALNGRGVLCEDFDTDRNSNGVFDFTRLPVGVSPIDPLRAFGDSQDDVLGYTEDAGPSPTGTDALVCSNAARFGEPTCASPVAEENDWHLHSPFDAPGDGYDPQALSGIGAPDGGKAHSGVRSMHMGRHLDAASTLGDATRFRQISAFVLDPPINLGSTSALEFWHLIRVPHEVVEFPSPATLAFGGGQVHISLLGASGSFEKWQRLTPSFNGYDMMIQGSVALCQFDPGDDEMPPLDESMCGPSPVWATLGDIIGTDPTCAADTDGNDPIFKDCGRISSCAGGPGCTENGSLGRGVWARSAFDLSPFAGRTARLRWIGSIGGGWSFGTSRSFLEPQAGNQAYQYFEEDDGWWIDDIRLTDLRRQH